MFPRGKTGVTSSQVRLARLPLNKANACRLKTRACIKMAAAIAAVRAPTDTPTKASRAGVRLSLEASRNISRPLTTAPATDREVTPQAPAPRTPAMARDWTMAAPPPSPKSWGSPKGLRVALWSSAPAAPRQAPTIKAATTLGMRNECTITSAAGSPPSAKSAFTSVAASRLAAPKATPATQPNSNATTRPARARIEGRLIRSLLPTQP